MLNAAFECCTFPEVSFVPDEMHTRHSETLLKELLVARSASVVDDNDRAKSASREAGDEPDQLRAGTIGWNDNGLVSAIAAGIGHLFLRVFGLYALWQNQPERVISSLPHA